jgi:hypothetical protein
MEEQYMRDELDNDPEVIAAFDQIKFSIETFRSSKSIHQFTTNVIRDLNEKQLIHSRTVYYHPKIRLDMVTQLLIHQLCIPRICDFLGMGFMDFSNNQWKEMLGSGNSKDQHSVDTLATKQNNYQLEQIREIFIEIFTIHRLTEDITIETGNIDLNTS